ncbi:GNAT family N-acetyltransferase [Burkholderiaceae bacterium FT117]|uniref:GNAT family N-acetyltransferase n=1 Tax=Zeimonas sediminis TaxID=2944268 RepID=UPI002342E120|nr:GNAT family N-acetyltransferase [Zeimonas sediminis]MCM5569038.1 GNAT family N-acetyltransferase [Zeimonas sediminis]
MDNAAAHQDTLGPLAGDDLEDVVAIDAAWEGRSRRLYFERRLAAALREPGLHAQFAVRDARGLAGYVLARVLEGEFGQRDRSLRLEAIGVRADARGRGIGRLLFDGLAGWAGRHGVPDLRTQAAWNAHRMLGWLDAAGFSLAAAHVVDRPVHGEIDTIANEPEGAVGDASPGPVLPGAPPVREIDYGRGESNDFERLARDTADIRALEPADLPDLARIDRGITGRDRRDYMARKLGETLADSALRVSLGARLDGVVVGFVMARADFGDFGRTEPVAVIDTIGVDPEYAHRGVGHALLSQLFLNLAALRIERVETQVAPQDLALQGFLYDAGFAPSQRLAFARRLGGPVKPRAPVAPGARQ